MQSKSPTKQKCDAGKNQKRDTWQGGTGQRESVSLAVKLEERPREPPEEQRHRFSPEPPRVKPHHTSDLWKCKMFNMCCVKLWCLQWFFQAAAGWYSIPGESEPGVVYGMGGRQSERKGIRETVRDHKQILENCRSHFKRFNFKKIWSYKRFGRGMAVFSKHRYWLLLGKQTIGGAGQPVQRC